RKKRADITPGRLVDCPTMNLKVNFEAATRQDDPLARSRPCRDWFFVGNYFCCDRCLWAPLNPRIKDSTPAGTDAPTHKSCFVQFKQNFFFYLCVLLLGGTNGSFLYFDGPYLIEHVHVLVVIISQVNFALVVVTLLVTACTDPGILTAATDEEAQEFG